MNESTLPSLQLDRVGLLLGAGKAQRAAAATAARAAGSRTDYGLAVFLARPYIATQTMRQGGFDPERHTIELELDQRARATELLDEVGTETRFSLFNVRCPALWNAARLAAEAECELLVVATSLGRAPHPARRYCERHYGLPIVSVAGG